MMRFDQRREAIRRLYRVMPGSPVPPKDEDGFYLWGEMDGNEYWEFCAVIVDLIAQAQGGQE
jgi:hypothetical protein